MTVDDDTALGQKHCCLAWVTLEGFLSYKNEATLGPLSPGINIIVGENGAGKSNLLYAIETLISFETGSLAQLQHLAVLSTAPGMRSNVATVKALLNNKSRHLPQEEDVVTVTRTIGPSAATLKIGNSLVGKKDFIDYLHAAGFSSENTFHIIRQGQVREVLQMTPKERLRMVQRFAGWDVLLQLEKLALECAELGDRDRKRIEEIINECRVKLQEDDQNIKEAKLYKALELDIRTVNLALLDKDADFFKATSQQIEDNIAETQALQAMAKQRHLRLSSGLQENKHKLKQLREEVQNRLSRLDDISSQLCQVEGDKVRESLHQNQFQGEISAAETEQQILADSRTHSHQAVKDMTLKLNKTTEALHALERSEDQLKSRVEELTNENHAVMQCVWHGHTFRTTQERNIWVDGEVQKLESILQDIQKQCEELQLEIESCTAERDRCISEEKKAQAELDSLRQLDGSMKVQLMQLPKQRYAAANKYVLAQRLEEDCQHALSKARNDLLRIQPRMVSAMGKDVFNAWQGLKRLLANRDDSDAQEYIGMLVDHLRVPDDLTLAVAVALGIHLFTPLVRSSKSATVLLNKFRDLNVPGCLGFLALDKARIQEEYPDPHGGGVRRLLDVVQCTNADLAPLLPYWLGSWLLCPDLEVAQEACRKYEANCVTPEGDIVRFRGAMTGGYHDPKKNGFAVYEEFCRLSDVLQSAESSLSESSGAVRRCAAESTEMSSKLQVLDMKVAQNTNAISSCEANLASLRLRLSQIEDGIKAKEQALHKRLETAASYQHQKKALLEERSSDRVEHLTASAEQKLLERTQSLQRLNERLKLIREERLKTQHKKNIEESTLKYCLLPELDRLNRESQALEHRKVALEREFELSKMRLAAAQETKDSLENQAAELMNNTDDQSCILNLERNVQEMSEEISRSLDDLGAASKHMEMLMMKRAGTLDALKEVEKKARMLGVVSRDLEGYRSMDRSQLEHERQHLLARLSRMDPPDLSAGRLVEEASKKLDDVCRQLQDLVLTSRMAREMTDSQEEQKFNDIEFTLKQVSKYFEDLFSKFVPRGRAIMVFHKKRQRGERRTDEKTYESIEFKASFSAQGVLQTIKSFSGGQKTVVALCFILALQKCDPAPFYIFDEVDACLDAEHRQCLADVLEELSSKSQFICTTFRPELTSKGKVFKVTQHQGVSSIAEITQREALQLLQARGDY
ncbi:structural maintenance of chromosomes protein 3-like [Amblyomma americanum]